MTLPSDLNMLTSSICWMGCTLSFFSVAWSFLSSPADRCGVRLTFLRGVPLPLFGKGAFVSFFFFLSVTMVLRPEWQRRRTLKDKC